MPKWLPAFIAALFLLRLGYLAFPDLFPEEAYYWNYAKHLDIAYLDHPPMVGWLISAGTYLFGDIAFGVRIGAFLCSLVTAFFIYRLTDLLYGKRAAALAVLLAQLLPFFFLTGFMITPDSPLTTCWAAMLYYLARVFFHGKASAWLGVGIWLGLGMLSKYTIALLGPATLLFLALDPASRAWFRRPAPYLAVALSILIFTPVLWWNAQHDWASFAFQGKERVTARRRFSLHELLASALAILTPLGVYLGSKLLGLGDRRDLAGAAAPVAGPKHALLPEDDLQRRRILFIRVFTLVPLSVFLFFSLTHRVKLNWTGPLWLALVPAVAAALWFSSKADRPRLRFAWHTTLAVLSITYVVFLQYLTHGIPGLGYAENTELLPVGWPELARAVETRQRLLEQSTGSKVMIVGMDRNFIASEAAFYHSHPAESVSQVTGAHLFGGRSLMYRFWRPEKFEEGATLLLVSFEEVTIDDSSIEERTASLGPIETHWIERDGKRVRPYYLREAKGYLSERPKKDD